MRYPALKGFRGGELAGQDKGVQAGFVDDGHVLLAGGGLYFGDTSILCVNVLSYCIGWFLIAKGQCHVLTHKPGVAVDAQGADVSELGAGELL